MGALEHRGQAERSREQASKNGEEERQRLEGDVEMDRENEKDERER